MKFYLTIALLLLTPYSLFAESQCRAGAMFDNGVYTGCQVTIGKSTTEFSGDKVKAIDCIEFCAPMNEKKPGDTSPDLGPQEILSPITLVCVNEILAFRQADADMREKCHPDYVNQWGGEACGIADEAFQNALNDKDNCLHDATNPAVNTPK